jgi:hypothetical protein
LANAGYFVLELGYNLPQYGQQDIYDRRHFSVEYIEDAIDNVLRHPKVYGQGFILKLEIRFSELSKNSGNLAHSQS